MDNFTTVIGAMFVAPLMIAALAMGPASSRRPAPALAGTGDHGAWHSLAVAMGYIVGNVVPGAGPNATILTMSC